MSMERPDHSLRPVAISVASRGAEDGELGDRHPAKAGKGSAWRARIPALLAAGRAQVARLNGRKGLFWLGKRLARVDLERPRRLGVNAWRVARRWVQANTFNPAWIPHRWNLPLVANAIAVIAQVMAVLLTLLLVRLVPSQVYPTPIVLLAIVLVALNWGAVPGLIATGVGGFLLNALAVPQVTPAALDRAAVLNATLVTVVGVIVSVAASRTERARRHAEDLAIDTERARLEADALRARLDAIIDAMADAVTVHDNLGKTLRINRAGRELFELDEEADDIPAGHERMERLGLLDDQGQPFAPERAPLMRILRGEVLTGTEAVDVIRRTSDGREMLLSLSGAPIRNSAGHITGAVTITRDVTERRRLERRTQDALDALLAMAEALVLAPGDIESARVVSGADGEAVEGAPAARSTGGVAHRLATLTRNLLGCQRVGILLLDPETERVRPLAVAALVPEQERQWWAEQPASAQLSDIAAAPIVARLRAGQMALLDPREPPRNDLPHPYGAHTILVAPMRLGQSLVGFLSLDHGGAAHVYTPDEMALAGAVAELTTLVIERERLLRDRAEARARALALNESTRRMNEFLAIASHELKTPLTVIKTNIQVMARRLSGQNGEAPAPQEVARIVEQAPLLLQRVERQTDRLTRLVEDLLDVTRIQAGKLEMRPALCDLTAIVAESVEEQRQAQPARTITCARPEGTPLMVVADPERISQVIINYLTNALKYSKEDRPVTVLVEAVGQLARVAVRDEGPGLPEEEHQTVWERFHRAAGIDVQSGSGVGLGLGLYISRTIVERHGGAVGVESVLSQGSTFWFTIPLAAAAAG